MNVYKKNIYILIFQSNIHGAYSMRIIPTKLVSFYTFLHVFY